MFNLTLVSANRKTGPIPVTMSSKATCPDVCSFKKQGCYGLGGPVNIHWMRITKGIRGQLWDEFVKTIKENIPLGQIWRHNQVGDLVGDNNNIDGESLKMLVSANTGRMGYTYTHKPVVASKKQGVSRAQAKSNREAIKHANANGFTINLSADNLKEADAKAKLKIGPVVVVLPSDAKETCFTPQGRKVIVCPATQSDSINCAKCKLCQRQRGVIIGFPAHGVSKNIVDKIISKS